VSMLANRKRLTWSELLPEYDTRMHAIGETVKLFLSGKKECELALTPVEQNRRAYEALQDRRLYAKWN
jgi:hypothetical protein